MNRLVLLFFLSFFSSTLCITWVTQGAGGKLSYNRDAKGTTIPNFSTVGYRGGNSPLPNIPVKKTVTAGADLQKAIQELEASLGAGEKGALLIKKGTYRVAGALKVSKSGVVLRGEGNGPDGTIILATGKSKRNLVTLQGPKVTYRETGPKFAINKYVPVGATTITLASAGGLKAGDQVLLVVGYNQKWIAATGMNKLPPRGDGRAVKQWSPFSEKYERKIVSVNGNTVQLEAPVVSAIDPEFGSSYLTEYTLASPRIQEVGIENLRLDSEFNKAETAAPKRGLKTGRDFIDEDHATSAVVFEAVENGWAADLFCQHFVFACVSIDGYSKYVTIQDSSNFDPVATVDGGRRYSFSIGDGSFILFQRLRTRSGRHDFVTGAHVSGPNVFFSGVATDTRSDIGPHHRWATGILYDNIESDGEINAENRGNAGSGHGWAGNAQVFWNCKSQTSDICSPPTGINWNIGYIGQVQKPKNCPLNVDRGDTNGKPSPIKSLYLAQMVDKHGAQVNSILAKRKY